MQLSCGWSLTLPGPNLAGGTCLHQNTLPGIFVYLLWIRNLRNMIFAFITILKSRRFLFSL